MKLILLDITNEIRSNFYPLALGRPIWELRCGFNSLGDKLIAKICAKDMACFVPDYMADSYRAKTKYPVNDLAVLQAIDASPDDVLRRRFGVSTSAKPDLRPADRARHGLRVESSVLRILVFATAILAHNEPTHCGSSAIVGEFLDDREARTAVRAVGERIAIAPFGHT